MTPLQIFALATIGSAAAVVVPVAIVTHERPPLAVMTKLASFEGACPRTAPPSAVWLEPIEISIRASELAASPSPVPLAVDAPPAVDL